MTKQPFAKKIARAILVVSMLNLALFAVVSAVMGGDGLNGKEQDGQYFLGMNGGYAVTSHSWFIASKVWAISVLLTQLLAVGAGFALWKLNDWKIDSRSRS